MAGFDDALRGYAYPIHRRDGFRCRYCGLDGTKSFASWLSLHWDHLLPKGHPHRDDPDFIVTACMFCNVADNRYFDLGRPANDTWSSGRPTSRRRKLRYAGGATRLLSPDVVFRASLWVAGEDSRCTGRVGQGHDRAVCADAARLEAEH